MRMYVNLLGVDDQFAVLSDGTAAVLSVHDLPSSSGRDPDGTRRSTPKMPFDWRALTDADKHRMMDSVRPELDRRNNVRPIHHQHAEWSRARTATFEFLPLDKFGDFEQPSQTGALMRRSRRTLWILPRTSLSAKDGSVVRRDQSQRRDRGTRAVPEKLRAARDLARMVWCTSYISTGGRAAWSVRP
jgi:hypothetical protein